MSLTRRRFLQASAGTLFVAPAIATQVMKIQVPRPGPGYLDERCDIHCDIGWPDPGRVYVVYEDGTRVRAL